MEDFPTTVDALIGMLNFIPESLKQKARRKERKGKGKERKYISLKKMMELEKMQAKDPQLDFPLTWKLDSENFVIFRYFEPEPAEEAPHEQVQGDPETYQVVANDQVQGDPEPDQMDADDQVQGKPDLDQGQEDPEPSE